jgi:hypothetical protein
MFKRSATDFDTQLTLMQPAQPVHVSTVSQTSCGILGKSEPHKCVCCSQININMECFTCRHSLGIWGGIWQQQESLVGLSQAFSEQCVSRLLYVCFCRLLPMGIGNTCSKQVEDDQFTYCNLMRMYFSIFRTIPPPAPAWVVMQLVWISSCVELCRWAAVSSFPLVEGAGSRPQQSPLLRPICGLDCAP